MPRQGWKTISIRLNLLERLNQIFEKDRRRPSNQKFNAWLENLLMIHVEHFENLMRYGGFIEYINAVDDHINLYDKQLNKSVTVFVDIKKGELHCDHHNSNDCLHIGFCYAIPEIYKILVDNGFRLINKYIKNPY